MAPIVDTYTEEDRLVRKVPSGPRMASNIAILIIATKQELCGEEQLYKGTFVTPEH